VASSSAFITVPPSTILPDILLQIDTEETFSTVRLSGDPTHT
jgi:hypothetical protein